MPSTLDSEGAFIFADSNDGGGGVFSGKGRDTAEGRHGALLGAEITGFFLLIYGRIWEANLVAEEA
jgi:hypothetical protein